MVCEIVVISGKGGTGKTSLAASFAVLARRAVIADCDVDAADLHLVLQPEACERHEFRCGHEAVIRQPDCIGCGACLAHCRFGAVCMEGRGAGDAVFTVDPLLCEGCGVCVRFCPVKAMDFPERLAGEWMVSSTRCGPMVHARLGVAAGNSGKLVSTVRSEARSVAERAGLGMLLVDGPPGIGCPVIASVAGASLAVVVAEPTVSGEHDLVRVLALARHFGIPAAVCVNKWDVNPEVAARIESQAGAAGAVCVGRIRYDVGVTRAQLRGRAAVEAGCAASSDIERVWQSVLRIAAGRDI